MPPTRTLPRAPSCTDNLVTAMGGVSHDGELSRPLDPRDLEAVTGGTLDGNATALPVRPVLPGDLSLPKVAQPQNTIPLGPFTPSSPQSNLA